MTSPQNAVQWQPPEKYRAAKSNIEGITVWEPLPETEAAPGPVTFTCPNCGATTRYDIAAGGVACEHCGFSSTAKSAQVGRNADAFEFTLETLQKSEQGWGVERQEIFCDACGAALALAEGVLSTTCPFCSSNRVNVHAAASDHLRPRFLVPFKVQKQQALVTVKEWLGRGWYHPKELSRVSGLERFGGIYLPFWTFSARIPSSWRAEVGHEHTERYYDAGSKEWKTRTTIRWRWEDGAVSTSISDLLVTGSAHVSRRLVDKIQPFDLNALVAYAPDFLAGWQAQAYEVSLQDSWKLAKDLMREAARKTCYDDIPTSHVRNFSMTADFDDESWRYILLPVYLLSYKFQEKTYQVMLNGQTGAIAGQKPVDWNRVWLAIGGMFAPSIFLGLVGLPLLALGGIGIIALGIALVLFVVAAVLSVMLFNQAKGSEAA